MGRPRLLATLVAIGATVMTACGPVTPPSSRTPLESTTARPAVSPSQLAAGTGGSGAPATAGAGPAWAVVHATLLPTRLPTGLSRSVAIVVGSSIDVYGGFASTGSTTGEILAFDPGAGRIGALGELAMPVHDAAGVALGGATVVFGGGSAAPTSVVQRVDSAGAARVIGNLPTPRADLVAVAIGASAFVLGGGASGVLAAQILTTGDGVHFPAVGHLVSAVRYPAVAATGGWIYVIGGAGAAGEIRDIQRVDSATGAVQVIGQMPKPISHASAMVIGGRIFVVGGRSAGTAEDAIWQLDVATGATQLVGRLPQGVSDFALAVFGGVGYAIGGETDTQVASIVAIVVE